MSADDIIQRILAAPEWVDEFSTPLRQVMAMDCFRAAGAMILEEAVEKERSMAAINFASPDAAVLATGRQAEARGLRRALEVLAELAEEKEKKDE